MENPPRYYINTNWDLGSEICDLLQWVMYDEQGRWRGSYGFARVKPDELDLNKGRFVRFCQDDLPVKHCIMLKRGDNNFGLRGFDNLDACISWVSENTLGRWNVEWKRFNANGLEFAVNFEDPNDAFHFKLKFG